LWNDNTGYFHDIGNPYRKRLESVTVANEGLNSLQEMWANQGKDLEGLFDFRLKDRFWNITGVEDVDTNAKTKQYAERLNNQVNAQLRSMRE
jgi:predicted RNA-binding protein (virulence factor B family)